MSRQLSKKSGSRVSTCALSRIRTAANNNFRFYFISILNSTYCSHILQLQYDKCLFIGEAECIWFHQRNHRNNVRISNETSSEWKEMFRGCPKAQILNVFEDDDVYNTDKSSIKMYAYDHHLNVCWYWEDGRGGKEPNEREKGISNWYQLNLMKCNS